MFVHVHSFTTHCCWQEYAAMHRDVQRQKATTTYGQLLDQCGCLKKRHDTHKKHTDNIVVQALRGGAQQHVVWWRHNTLVVVVACLLARLRRNEHRWKEGCTAVCVTVCVASHAITAIICKYFHRSSKQVSHTHAEAGSEHMKWMFSAEIFTIVFLTSSCSWHPRQLKQQMERIWDIDKLLAL